MPTTPTDSSTPFASPAPANSASNRADSLFSPADRIECIEGTNTAYASAFPALPLPLTALVSKESLLKPTLTDTGNAERLVLVYRPSILYCHKWRKWLVWNKRQWHIDGSGTIERLAKETITKFGDAAWAVIDEDKKKRLVNHFFHSQSDSRLRAMISLAESEVPVVPNQLDTDLNLLNCLNGIINLKTGELLKHSQKYLCTKLAPVNYDANAKCPTFEAFLERAMGGKQSLINFLQRSIGYALTGNVNEKAIFFLYGDGDNGKTTFLETIKTILGDYAGQLPVSSLMAKRQSDGSSNDIAQLRGLRFVTSSEAEQGAKLAEAKVKYITGMGTVQARFLYGELFEFPPTHKIFVDANHKPEIRGDDNAVWNRIKLIPFTVSIPKEEQDKNLAAKLRAEATGILAWAVRGCVEWQKHGLGTPKEINNAVADYRNEMDIVKDFIEERCVGGLDLRIKTSTLYDAFKEWCKLNEQEPLSKAVFVSRLKKMDGLQPCKIANERGWQGINVNAAVDGQFDFEARAA